MWETPLPSVVVVDTCRMTLPVKPHPNVCTNGNVPTAKLPTVVLPNTRVSDASSKIVGGDWTRNGSVTWNCTPESVSGNAPALTVSVNGTEKGCTAGQMNPGTLCRVSTDDPRPTKFKLFWKPEGAVVTPIAVVLPSSHADATQHITRIAIAEGMAVLMTLSRLQHRDCRSGASDGCSLLPSRLTRFGGSHWLQLD